MPAILKALYSYPLKSGAPLNHTQGAFDPRGLDHDRRWALCGPDGRLLTARQHPVLLRMRCRAEQDELLVEYGGEMRRFPANMAVSQEISHYAASFQGRRINDEADRWFSELLGLKCHLVWNHPDRNRMIQQKDVEGDHPIRLVDAAPILLCTEASLAELNRSVSPAVDMRQFRPNVVIGGSAPWAEREWQNVFIGPYRFRAIKSCTRCILTTFDPDTALARKDGQPLKYLQGLPHEFMSKFGIYLLPLEQGVLELGMSVLWD